MTKHQFGVLAAATLLAAILRRICEASGAAIHPGEHLTISTRKVRTS